MLKIEIKNKLAKETLERAINKEITILQETMDTCDLQDLMQYQVYHRAKQQFEELEQILNDLDQ